MKGYSTREVAAMLGLSERQVRTFARSGFLTPIQGARRGELRFTFTDLVLLRAAKELSSAQIPTRKIRTALLHLHEQLPKGRPLTAVRISAEGDRVVVRDGDSVWYPESGQGLFDFAVSELAHKAAPISRRAAALARTSEAELAAEDWFDLASDLEITAPEEARDAYRRAVELDPLHADAHTNLGRLLHEQGAIVAAEAHYRVALDCDPGHPIAAFNLGVALEDLGRLREASDAYLHTLSIDPELADAYYNLSGICERLGKPQAALRHLKAYRKIVQGR